MSVKNILLSAAAGVAIVATSAAFAGGPDHMAPPAPAFHPNIYVEGNVGYADTDWSDINFGTSGDDDGTGFTGGVDVGYHFRRHFAVEMGWQYLPETKVVGTTNFDRDSWFIYGALKLLVPVMDNVDLYGKVGVLYRDLSGNGTATVPGGTVRVRDGDYIDAYFAAGAQYAFMHNWLFGVQYSYVPGDYDGSSPSDTAPCVSLYTVSVGYKFNV